MTPYHPSLSSVAAVYRLEVGATFYIGSTRALGPRFSDHAARLTKGIHSNPMLQKAHDDGGAVSLVVLETVARKHDDSDKDHSRRLKFREQAHLTPLLKLDLCANRSESTTHNTGIGEWMKTKWQDPVFREKQITRMKLRKGGAVSLESRSKMAEAKRGSRNPKARPCQVGFAGELRVFPCGASAAAHFKVSQQVMDLWLRGEVPWPGTGKRAPRQKHLVGLTGRYLT